jgi:pyruvate formate lyase activating enzyme
VIRIPVIPSCNNSDENIRESARFIADLGFTQIELMPYHEFGVSKYRQYDMVYPLEGTEPASRDELRRFRNIAEGFGLQDVTGCM